MLVSIPLHVNVEATTRGVHRVQLEAAPHLMLEARGTALKWLTDYFSGLRGALPVFDLPPLTYFAQRVLGHLLTIPYGTTQTYSEVALAIGYPGAARAVGSACSRNPIPLFIPCHRVVSMQGLGGYTPDRRIKQALLELESA